MPNFILIEEFHISLSVLEDLPETEVKRIRRALAAKAFREKLRQAIRSLLKSRGIGDVLLTTIEF